MIDLRPGPGSGVFEVLVSRRVTEPDLEHLKRQLELTVADVTDPRVLCCIAEFWGFDSQDLWDDLRHWLRHLRRPVRIAVLGERKWIDLVAGSRWESPSPVEMRGFEMEHEAQARRWLGSISTEIPPEESSAAGRSGEHAGEMGAA
jgi:hypothetical protein